MTRRIWNWCTGFIIDLWIYKMQAFCVSNVCNILLPRVLMRVFTRAVCLEEGYNIVAARSQKPIPPCPRITVPQMYQK